MSSPHLTMKFPSKSEELWRYMLTKKVVGECYISSLESQVKEPPKLIGWSLWLTKPTSKQRSQDETLVRDYPFEDRHKRPKNEYGHKFCWK